MASMLKNIQEAAQAGLQATVQAVNERVDTARAGKKLLEDGGDAAADALRAKQLSISAVASDSDIVQRIQSVITMYEESAAKLRKANLCPKVEGISGYDEFIKLAEAYEGRAKAYRQAAELLREPASAASITPQEKDALALLQVKGGYDAVRGTAMGGLEAARRGLATGSCDEGVNPAVPA